MSQIIKQLSNRLSYSYRHHDYHKWIGPEDGYNPDGTRKGVVHFVYTLPWYNGIIDCIMWDVFNMDYTYNHMGQFGWAKVYDINKLFKEEVS